MNLSISKLRWYQIAVSISLLFVCGVLRPPGAQAAERAAQRVLDSYEFKVLLKNDKFAPDRDVAVNAFLGRLTAIASKQGAATDWKEPDKRKPKQREVRFLDTGAMVCTEQQRNPKSPDVKGRCIEQQGLIFRTRIEMQNACDPADLDACAPKKAKVTLKQRFGSKQDGALRDMTPNPDVAKAFPTQVVSAKSKFEEDFGWRLADKQEGVREMVSKKSLSSSLEVEDLTERQQVRVYGTLREVMDLYPMVDWGDGAAHTDEALSSPCPITSTVVKVGKLKFGGVECKASFSFWRKETDQSALASEFSYSCPGGDAFDGVRDTTKAVFESLIQDSFVNPLPDTKTAIARRCASN